MVRVLTSYHLLVAILCDQQIGLAVREEVEGHVFLDLVAPQTIIISGLEGEEILDIWHCFLSCFHLPCFSALSTLT